MGKSTISMAIFHCYVSSPEGTIGFPSQFGMILPLIILGPMLVSLRGATRCHAKSWPLGFAKFGLADVQSPVA